MWGNTTAGGGSIGAQDINDRLDGEYRAAVAEFETRQQAWQARRDAGEEAGERPAAPALRDFVKSDTTIEALIGVLQDNPAGC